MGSKKAGGFQTVLLLIIIFTALTGLGFLRDQYILNLHQPALPLLVSRSDSGLAVNALAQLEASDPRWLTLPAYIILYCSLSTAALYLIFRRKEAIVLSTASYGFLVLLSGLLLGIYFLIEGKSKAVVFILAQQLKEFMLSPFITLLLIAIYYAALRKGD